MIIGKYEEEEGEWCSRALREDNGVAFGRQFGVGGRGSTTGLVLGWEMVGG